MTYYGGGNHHSGLGYYGGASVLYGPTIYNSNPYYGRNDQARNYPRQQAGDGLAAGKRYLKEGSYARAVEAFLRSVLAAPQDGVPKLYFGLAHFSVGDYGYAVYAIRRGAARMPNWGEEEMDLRYLYGSRADFARHLDALTAYANRDIADGDAHFLLGYVFYFTGQYTPAWEQFDQALQIDPGDRQAATLRRLAIKRLDS